MTIPDLQKIKPHLPQTAKSSAAYSLGMGLGGIIIAGLFAIVDLARFSDIMQAELLLIGILIAIFIAAIGSGVGGAIGSVTLPLPPDIPRTNWSKAWRGGLSMGLFFGILIFLLGFALSVFSFYGLSDIDSVTFSSYFAAMGLLFGALFGLLLGLLMVGKRGVWHVALAGMIGFGIGGFGLGEGVRQYLLSVKHAELETGTYFWMMLGYLFFGLAGGAAIGFVFSYLAEKMVTPHKGKAWHWAVAGGMALLIFLFVRPILAAAVEAMLPHDANLAFVLDSETMGTHWMDSRPSPIAPLAGVPQQPMIAANADGQLAQVWSQADGETAVIYWLSGRWDAATRVSTWDNPVSVSSNGAATNPQAVVDERGTAHLVWEENSSVFYSQCREGNCTTAVSLSETPVCAADVTAHTAPSIAIDGKNGVMAVWQGDNGRLFYRTWSADQNPIAPADCVPIGDGVMAEQPRIDGENGQFSLVYAADDGRIYAAAYVDGGWDETVMVGNGRLPNVFLDAQNQPHFAWCDGDTVHYRTGDDVQTISELSCGSRPELAQDSEGTLHLLWYGDAVVNVDGAVQPQMVIYESVSAAADWTEPTIVSRTGTAGQPSVTAVADSLHMVWEQAENGRVDIAYAPFIPYNCDDYPLDGIAQAAYEIARLPAYRPEGDLIPYCQNQYHQLVYMPNPQPEFSGQQPTVNGGFDAFAELAQTAEYEVLFSTMWYEKDQNQDSPGYVLATSIAELYAKVKANPEQYPRGMTVRILLGNPPELAVQEFSGQLFYALNDLREAGVEKMVDPSIGWRVQVANFDGHMPHSHTKVMLVDGKTILAAGFNMQYEHYPADHPSGLGAGRQDLGMLISGPVAQNSLRMYDDLWEGSDQRVCDFSLPDGIWQAGCVSETAVSDHVPEVMHYYLPGGDDTAFSMYRNEVHDEADRIVEAGLMSADKTIDAMHVMFAMEMECDLNLLYNLCDFGEATEYLEGLMVAAENGVNIRLILKPQPTDGIESSVAYDVFTQELVERGIRDQVDIRFFRESIHYKTTLIDDEFLIVGSQNFHYSAFGEGSGLTEYSLGTDSAQAIDDFKRLFAYQWEQAESR